MSAAVSGGVGKTRADTPGVDLDYQLIHFPLIVKLFF